MNLFTGSSKKIIKIAATAVAGIFILSGATLAADNKFKENRHERYFKPSGQVQIDHDKAAEKMAAAFGLSKENIKTYQAQGYTTRDLFTAGLFAKAGAKPYNLVISMKTKENSWKDVAKNLNISPEQIRTAKTDMAASHMSKVLNTNQRVIKDLLETGYKHHDIMSASVLAKRTDKPINDVLSLKKINNTWQEVAESIGVNRNDFKNDMHAMFEQTGFALFDKKPSNDKKYSSDKKYSKKPGSKFDEKHFGK